VAHLDQAQRGRIDRRAVDALLARARQEVEDGVLPSCQIALAHNGELVAFETYGDASSGTRFVVFSCIKAFVAGAVWTLMGDGVLDVSLPVAVLGPPEWSSRQSRLEVFAGWALEWEPGTRYGYHPTSAHWVLGEIIERVSGRDVCDFVQRRVSEPAGLPGPVLGVPSNQQADIATIEIRGEVASADELEAVLGVRELPSAEAAYEALLYLNMPEVRALGIPGGGGIMRADHLALFYQALLHNPGGIWRPDILADATGRVRNRFPDPLFASPANRTLGLTQAGDDGLGFIRGFGTATSPRAFGHGGAAGQIGWADPETGLSLGFATNGVDVNVIRQGRRGIEISTLGGACVVGG
jgi:CubicO group peptidase (beta-lactamase class C family)